MSISASVKTGDTVDEILVRETNHFRAMSEISFLTA